MPKSEVEQVAIFDVPMDWEKEWQGMPEFKMGNTEPVQRITVNFASREDVERFAELVGQRLTTRTDSIWFPKPGDYVAPKSMRWDDEP
ncbi:hypothetical protein UFOVP452_56 [uncultured Caudovirales phage]|uniref:Uncharacterized protein n=1 Tax=uncultured Caudovirales phage TaxID=2100421 RepID=A0A6J5MCA2_9CAUD|nr:hypothetical protein UFOVP452_56 [uncultured Caudovirales phage]